MVNLDLDWVESIQILTLFMFVLFNCVYIYGANDYKKDIQRGFDRLEREIEKQKESEETK